METGTITIINNKRTVNGAQELDLFISKFCTICADGYITVRAFKNHFRVSHPGDARLSQKFISDYMNERGFKTCRLYINGQRTVFTGLRLMRQ